MVSENCFSAVTAIKASEWDLAFIDRSFRNGFGMGMTAAGRRLPFGHERHRLRGDLDLAPFLAGLLVVPPALLQPAFDEGRVSLVEILPAVLGLLAEDDDVHIADLFPGYLALLVLSVHRDGKARNRAAVRRVANLGIAGRSEEHTSELQSPLNLVCRLLLEKKKEYC